MGSSIAGFIGSQGVSFREKLNELQQMLLDIDMPKERRQKLFTLTQDINKLYSQLGSYIPSAPKEGLDNGGGNLSRAPSIDSVNPADEDTTATNPKVNPTGAGAAMDRDGRISILSHHSRSSARPRDSVDSEPESRPSSRPASRQSVESDGGSSRSSSADSSDSGKTETNYEPPPKRKAIRPSYSGDHGSASPTNHGSKRVREIPRSEGQISTTGKETLPEVQTTMVVSSEHGLSWYRSMDLSIRGVRFPNMATALAYFVALLHGKKHQDSRRQAAWLLPSRDNDEYNRRAKTIFGCIQAKWFEDHVPPIAQAIRHAAQQQPHMVQRALDKLGAHTQQILQLGEDTVFCVGSTTATLPEIPGRNLLGYYILKFHREQPAEVDPINNLLANQFPVGSNFLLVMDSQGRGISGLPPASVAVVPGMYAYHHHKTHKSAVHIISGNTEVETFSAIVICVGTNHVGDPQADVEYDVANMVRKIRKHSAAFILIIGPPCRYGKYANPVGETVKAMKAAAKTTGNCAFADISLLTLPPTELKRCVGQDGYHPNTAGKLRLMTQMVGYLPQLRLELKPNEGEA